MRKLTLFLYVLCLGVLSAMAQTRISGTVLSAEDDSPVMGASVLVKGGNATALTDIDGKFTIVIPQGASKTLVISFIGMEKAEVFARDGMVVRMNSASHSLDEVLVVGYGTQRREAKTGSITQVSGDELDAIPATSVDKMLSGKLAGVQIASTSGQPGSATSIRIRGTSSINAGNEPLYVVDGIPITSGSTSVASETMNAIALINPSDIASVTVLKDAAAASIYGSRAANGVILITTKTGSKDNGKASVTLRARYGGTMLANDNDFGMMNLQQYVQYYRDAATNAGYDPDMPGSEYYMPLSAANGKGTDWMDLMTRTGQLQEYEAIVSGGNSKTNYYTSLSYSNHESIIVGNGFEKMQMRANMDSEINKWLKFGTRIQGGYMKSVDTAGGELAPGNPFWSGMAGAPTLGMYNADGTFIDYAKEAENFRNGQSTFRQDQINAMSLFFNINPLMAIRDMDKWDKQYKVYGTAYLEWKPIKQLTFKTNNSVEFAATEAHIYYPHYILESASGNALNSATQFNSMFTTSNTITYNDVFADDHYLNVMVGQEAYALKYWWLMGSSQQVDADYKYHSSVASKEYSSVSDGLSNATMVSFFAMADYNYASKYYLQLALRTDGSSKFGADNRWGTFWAIGASWNMHNENFLKDVSWLNQLKLRYSYGVNGNDDIGFYQHYGLYGVGSYNGVNISVPGQLPNKDLTWELNKTHNVGIDFRIFDRLNVTVEWYTRKTEDMLLATAIPTTTGFSSIMKNAGSIRNNGVEVQLDATIFDTNDFQWTAGLNFAANRSKVLDLNGQEYLGSSIRYVVGKSLMNYYLYDYAGVNPMNGNALWRDEQGQLTEDAASARRVYAGSPEPKWFGGFNTNLTWKGLSLDIQLEAKYGNKVYNNDRGVYESDGSIAIQNLWKGAANYWKKPGDTNCLPKPIMNNSTNSSQLSTRYVEDGSYLRIKDVTLAYTLPQKWTKKALMNNVRFYVSALNLYTFHNMNYWDPEHGMTGSTLVTYPMTRSVIGGIDITF